MVQGVNQLQAINAPQLNKTGKNVNFGATTPYPPDTFKGKGLLMLAGAASALIFRKNIAGFFQKTFPGFSNFVAKNFQKATGAIKNFCAKNKFAGTVADFISNGIAKAKGLFQKITGFLKPQAATAKTAPTDIVNLSTAAIKPVVNPDVAKAVAVPPTEIAKVVTNAV